MWLSEEEQIIIRFLGLMPGGASAREICRKAATKNRWKEDERWAIPFLQRLRDKHLIETNAGGLFKLVAKAEK